jgi:hypothetical protein
MPRISREYVFDLLELVGKAVSTARKKAAGPKWDLDEQIDLFLRRWSIAPAEIDEYCRKAAEEDEYGLFEGSSWRDSAAGVEGSVDERENRRDYSPWGSEAFEQRKAQRHYDDFGDSVSCSLWELQRRLRFKELGVRDALKELQEQCHRLRGYISTGWANRLAAIIDHWSA